MLAHAPRVITDQDLLRYTGQTAVRNAATAEMLVDDAEEAAQLAATRLRRHTLSLPGCFLRYCGTAVTTGSDHGDAAILGAVLALPCMLFLAMLLRPPLPAAVALCLLTAGLLYGVFWLTLSTRPEELGKDRVERRLERWRRFFQDRSALAEECRAAETAVATRRQLLAQLRRAERRADEILALLSVDFRALSGRQFEEFLGQVFRVHGYAHVEVTQASGDQGLDLVVGDGRERIGIQAKLYQGAVGNDAVQQAFAGIAHYRCDRCVVITNSTFTRSAYELAASTGCKLIDGDVLRRVIAGKERV